MKLDIVIGVLCFVMFMQNTSTSIFAPFLPVEAQKKGISTFWVGILMSTQSISYIISAYAAGKLLKQVGRSVALAFGFFLLICQLFGMGSLFWSYDSYSFMTLGLLAQICGGIGAGINCTASLALLTSHYPEQREQIMSLFEAATGLGFLLGPLIGAGLYSLGGYILPFYGLSVIYIIILPVIIYIGNLVQKVEEQAEAQAADALQSSADQITQVEMLSVKTYDITVDVRYLLRVRRFVGGIAGQFVAYFSLQFIGPVLALRLADFGQTPEQNGLLFAIPSLIYILHMPFIFIYTRYVSKRVVIISGFALLAFSMLLIGNSPWLWIPESLRFTMLGLVMLGLGFSAIVVPIFPEILEGVEQKHPQYRFSNELNDVAAGIFNASMGLGETFGPVVSGVLNASLGFTQSQEVLAAIVGIFSVIYFVSCADREIFQPSAKEEVELGETDVTFLTGSQKVLFDDEERRGGKISVSSRDQQRLAVAQTPQVYRDSQMLDFPVRSVGLPSTLEDTDTGLESLTGYQTLRNNDSSEQSASAISRQQKLMRSLKKTDGPI